MEAKLSATTIKNLRANEKPYEVLDTEVKGFLLRVQPTGRMTFYYSYRNSAGKRNRIKLGTLGTSMTAAQARDAALQMAGDVARGADPQKEKAAGRQAARDQLQNTLEAFMMSQYQPWALANLKSGEQTIKSVKRSFPDLFNTPMSEIQFKVIERWRTTKLASGTKPATINRVVNSLRSVLTKAVEWEIIPEHPLGKLRNLRVDQGTKARFLSVDEESRLYTALAKRDDALKNARARGNKFRLERGYTLKQDLSQLPFGDRMTPLITLALKTGMRRGELFDLEWQDVDFDTKIVTVRGENAKSSKTRHIPLSPSAYEAITAWQQQSPLKTGRVFPADETGARLNNVNKSWASILNDANISAFRWHDMRHDFASKLVMNGVPLNTVRELCGHANLNTTLRYAHLAPDHKTDAVALIG